MNKIETAFFSWITIFPESHHPLDMVRFYSFVKVVCRYSRKPKDGNWLKLILNSSGKNFDTADIDYYVGLFDKLIAFNNTKIIDDKYDPLHYKLNGALK